MPIRRGRDQYLEAGEFATIPLAHLAHALRIGDGETMEDVRQRLDPERICHVLGVTRDGRFDGEIVPTYGEKLLTNGTLGVDLLVVPPGAGFPVHVHQGHHLLLVIQGRGTFSLDHHIHEVQPGDLSMIEGMIPHAVGNPYDQPHCLLAIGAPPRELDAEDRMTVTDWDGQPVLVAHGHGAQTIAGHAHDHTHQLDHAHVEA